METAIYESRNADDTTTVSIGPIQFRKDAFLA